MITASHLRLTGTDSSSFTKDGGLDKKDITKILKLAADAAKADPIAAGLDPAAFEAAMADGVGREDDHVFQATPCWHMSLTKRSACFCSSLSFP